jgi:hypothetical protein
MWNTSLTKAVIAAEKTAAGRKEDRPHEKLISSSRLFHSEPQPIVLPLQVFQCLYLLEF